MTESIDFKIPKIRTVQEIVSELKKIDPKTAITEFFVRQECKKDTSNIFHFESGKKYLINLEKFIEFLNTPTDSIQKAAGNNKYGISQIN